MPKLKIIKTEQIPKVEEVRVKQKRKNSHPVRTYFERQNDTQQKCRFCGWLTRENATRMVAHIVHRCKNSSAQAREDMNDTLQDAEERERESSFTNFNKKDIHNLFNSIDNDRKRECVFCKWTTIRNLTRMRNHIMQLCILVPPEIRARFLKQEYPEEQCDSYCIINVEGDDRKELHIVSSTSLKNSSNMEVMDEVTINTIDYDNQEETYNVIGSVESDTEQAADTQERMETVANTKQFLNTHAQVVQEIEVGVPSDEEEVEEDCEDMEYVTDQDDYYTVKELDEKSIVKHVEKVPSPKDRKVNRDVPMDKKIINVSSQRLNHKHKMAKFSSNISVTGVAACCLLFWCAIIVQESRAAVPEDGGSCHSFGGGHVYPQEAARFVDHKLQYTKALISRPAPEFEATAVVDGAFKKIKLSDYRGKYLVFFFYPLDFTFVCPTEILAFSDRVAEFKKLNAEVIAASIDSHFTHLAWINTPRKEGGLGKINIPLVSDITHNISKDYGVFLDDLGHTLRGLFIIDDRGVLRQITMNDLPVGRSVDETLRLVQAFQYTDKHGEVCPAGWVPGQDTIVPNPKEKMKYFEKNN
ncbi:uncharacterized protein LOC128724539 [Anopheles nili]|uniref:uncharacterized protein LOC128724539 n=1 Tax=Anopheles nili TaxID=185578 RepID=UPI00237BA329|nr:uncharacterized protein LOC128724539 [Anopheles nili]